jgi:thiol-disulfide isomerase/thioredoxin
MSMRRVLAVLVVVAVAAVVVIGLTQAGGSEGSGAASTGTLAQATRKLAGSPPSLAALHAQANKLLGGGKPAFEKRLAALRGRHPVVINKWASWCVPCQAEFPVFESVGTARGKDVAFLGVNGTDRNAAARRFLARRWLPFPSYTDPDENIARAIKAPKNYPMTVFIDRDGKTAYIHSGPYKSDSQLESDIDKYLS